VVPLDHEHVWFRYHHRFRSLLLAQLERSAPELIGDLHRRASSWYADRGAMVPAIEHAIATGDMEYAADEIDRRWFEFFATGQIWTLVDSMDRLSDEAIADHPMLAVVRAGLARAVGRIDEIEEWLQLIDRSSFAAPAPGLATTIEGAAAQMRSMHRLGIGDVPGAIAQTCHAP
jgi:ATP/maltotriose-dependent transcriptional regulator MalT